MRTIPEIFPTLPGPASPNTTQLHSFTHLGDTMCQKENVKKRPHILVLGINRKQHWYKFLPSWYLYYKTSLFSFPLENPSPFHIARERKLHEKLSCQQVLIFLSFFFIFFSFSSLSLFLNLVCTWTFHLFFPIPEPSWGHGINLMTKKSGSIDEWNTWELGQNENFLQLSHF